MSDTKQKWRENDATKPGQAVCEACDSDTFKLGVNGSESVKIRCAECDYTVAFCWYDDSGNTLTGLKPRYVDAGTDRGGV